jgi:hypothetical protein
MTATALAPIVQGDLGVTRITRLSGVEDLTAASSVKAHLWKARTPPATLTAQIIDPTARTVRIIFGTTADEWLAEAEPGTYWVEIEILFGDGTLLTWPEPPDDAEHLDSSECTILVRKQGG